MVKVDSWSCPKSVKQCQLHQPGQTSIEILMGRRWDWRLLCVSMAKELICAVSDSCSHVHASPPWVPALLNSLFTKFWPPSLWFAFFWPLWEIYFLDLLGMWGQAYSPRTDYAASPHMRVPLKLFKGSWVPPPLFIILAVWAAFQVWVVPWNLIKLLNRQNVLTRVFLYMKVGGPPLRSHLEFFHMFFSSKAPHWPGAERVAKG